MYTFTNEPIDQEIRTTKLAGFAPWTNALDQDAKITHWPTWTKYKQAEDRNRTEQFKQEINHEFLSTAYSMSAGRQLVVTEQGILGLAPAEALVGDLVYVFFAGALAYILRPNTEGSSF